MPSGKEAVLTQKSQPLRGSWWSSQGFYLSHSKIRYDSTETIESQFESQCIFFFLIFKTDRKEIIFYYIYF